MQNSSYNTYSTFNNGTDVTVFFAHVTHIIADKESGCWIWFANSKCVHVLEDYPNVVADVQTYWDN